MMKSSTENNSGTIYLLSEMEKRVEDLLVKIAELEIETPPVTFQM